MLISRKLLDRYVDLEGIPTLEIADALTNAGLEVEGISQLVKGTNLTVGYVETCVDHPDSDHLHVCTVNVGKEVLQIVCGAPNVAQGQTVIVALPGAVLPGITIKKSSVRGVESNGMICSLQELGVHEKFVEERFKDGIVALDKGEPGSDPRVALGLDDEIIDVSQTPNRSDFLSLFAVAHEVSALMNRKLTLPNYENAASVGSKTELTIHSDTPDCNLFIGKVINKVTIKDSPDWIKHALIGSGVKPINNVVDISNLVMLETGQPLHFYDRSFLNPLSLSVSSSISKTVTALDDKEYALELGDLVIMNGETPVGIAGIMGLGNSMIQHDTQGIVIEAARFNRVKVRKTANRFTLNTESSSRFSKPMDDLSAQKAVDRSVQLLIDYADAELIEETVVFGNTEYTPIKVSVSYNKINAYLGTNLSMDVVFNVFERLYFEPVVDEDTITCTIPSYRQDIFADVDLIEEVIRVVGYDVLGETLPLLDLTMGSLTPRQTTIRSIEKILLGLGADQINTYTLVEEAWTQGGESLENPIPLMSPISDKRTHLRTQLAPSVLDTIAYNVSRRQDNLLFFEHSKIYGNSTSYEKLAIVGTGTLNKVNWLKETVTLDFFALKGLFLSLVEQLGFQPRRFTFETKDFDETLFHPYQSASIYFDRKRIGVLGTIHPLKEKELGIKKTTLLEIYLDLLFASKKTAIKASDVRVHPTVTRDLALLCDKEVTAQALIQTIEKASRRLLLDVNVFDLFTSEKLGDQKSLAIELVLGSDHTLSETEIQTVMKDIQDKLVSNHNVSIR
ncbi:phenylalanine--tRNA ligase subunit beta [Erysipelothrix larvae]|uniref:Phenylalanine--tRNA ligase beta subunit n=1 Tax=Erysipelothrix larvae TaxID=1514105 RepID=A0A109UGW2_9FIRM|nr:phenylalanine--tRNA ligase subunit beta [Erysipelothrix larvae]AMC93271.1 phenylalanine--tRNA ligase subunit beta [Erysipelothrix larvae]